MKTVGLLMVARLKSNLWWHHNNHDDNDDVYDDKEMEEKDE